MNGPGSRASQRAEEREQAAKRLEIEARYSGYIERQGRDIERAQGAEATSLPSDIDYATVKGLSNEVREKLGPLGLKLRGD